MTAEFGARLRETRMERGMSASALAREAGLTPGGICNFEMGRSEPRLSTAARLAAILGVTIDYLAVADKDGD